MYGVGPPAFPSRLSFGQAAGARCPFFLVLGAAGLGPVTITAGHPLASWRCVLWGPHEGTRGGGGGRLVPLRGVSGVGHSPSPDRPSLGQAAGACCPFFLGAGGVGVEAHHPPHSALSCELALGALEVAGGRPEAGGASYLREGCRGFGTLSPQTTHAWYVLQRPAALFVRARGTLE